MYKLVIAVAVVVVPLGAYFWASRDGYDSRTVRNKRVLVTGSSSGIGEHVAYEYSKLGAKLMLTARRKALLEKVAQKCKSLGASEVHIFAGDMGIPQDRVDLVTATDKVFDGLDYLVLNHADLGGQPWASTPADMDVLNSMMNTNFVSFVDLTSRFLPVLKSEGHVAVVTSIAGKMGTLGAQAYSASKHALHGFYASWRQDLRYQGAGVSFTLCVLGPTATEHLKAIFQMIKPDAQPELFGTASPVDAAVAIVRATTTRQREMYHGYVYDLVMTLHKFFPAYVEDKMADHYVATLTR